MGAFSAAEAYDHKRNKVIHSDTCDVFAARETAYQWHGGQWSPLYSFASTGAIVHSEEHREGLIGEIEECQRIAVKSLTDAASLCEAQEALENLLATVKALPVKPS